ncbi:MAG: Hsp20/alpha crystallin family protein [Labilithrix sp.]|nr:Hsp20/alpha crystallin family protein [Labilithrix sp.]
MMRRLLGWDPFQEMAPFVAAEEAGLTFMPAFEVKETKDAYEFRADIPGVAEDDIELTVTGNRLTISGSREAEVEDKKDRYFATERLYGSFVRTFTLPDGVDPEQVTATLANGVLRVVVPKKPETQPKKIAVTSQETHQARPIEHEAEVHAESSQPSQSTPPQSASEPH